MSTHTHQDRAPPLARPASFFGAIKDIVTAPFTWFAGSDDEFEDTKGKRRRHPGPSEDAQTEDAGVPSRAKRIRVSSPDRDAPPYLDPPRSAFAHPRLDVVRSPRKTLHLPPASSQPPHSRRTLSPLPSSSHLKHQGLARTMSLDPPSLSTRTRPHSETNASRDVSMSPRHLRFRSSLTPQPLGTGFGPLVPPRRERGLDEPPPLTALMSNPMFVRPPPPAQKQAAAEPPKPLTLGTLIDSQRNARPPARQSSILFGTGSTGQVWPVNKAEVALHELEVYKTPLLPTRLKGAAAVPDMFLHKERKHLTLMTDDRPDKPRLGTKSKGKGKGKKRAREKETMNGTKPYAGEGGMKKWLARRKREEEEAKEKERADAMEDERAEEEKKHKDAGVEKKRDEEFKLPPSPPPAPVFEPRASREGQSSSSLRVGRTRTGRSHIERPASRRVKFSAAFEDEDEDMEESRAAEQQVLEEAAKKVPVFELPAGFTFAKETTITHDLNHAKEPPITSLPFSLTKPAPAPAPAPVPAPPPPPVTVSPTPTPAPVPPTISLVPPTPETVKVAPVGPSSSSAAPTPLSPFTFGASPPAPSSAPAAPTTPAAPTAPAEAPKSVFTFGQSAPAAASTSAPVPATAPPSTDTPKPIFGTPPPATPFSFGSTAPAEGKPATTPFSFGTPTVEKKPTTGFTFGPPGTSATGTAAPAPFGFGTTPSGTAAADVSKPFTFGSGAPARPATPPKAVQEVTMDESPVRDMVVNGSDKAPERPTLNFTFNTPGASALFAQSPATTTASFNFGAPGTTVNPFSKEDKKEAKPSATFGGFGQTPSTGFPFGQKPPESPAATTPAAASFQFPTSPSVAPASPFPFGAAPTSATPFVQPSTTSAPSSPSTFTRPASFAFGPSATTQPAASNLFVFGPSSQPTSPANGNTTLPSGTTGNAPFTFGAGANAGGAPAVGFGAAAPAGASLFTMGSVPPPTEGVGGRRIKGLPRRGARR